MTFEELKKELINKIQKGEELNTIFDILLPALSNNPNLLDECTTLSYSYNAIERQLNKGVILREEYSININRIVNSLSACIRNELTSKDLNLTHITEANTQATTPLSTPIMEGIQTERSPIQSELTRQNLNSTATLGSKIQELSPLSKAIQEMGLKKPLGTAALVNCDRNDANTRFNKFFSAKDETTPYQFYFILGSADQLPERFGERLIYTIRDEYIDENDQAAFDFRQSEEQVKGVMALRATIEELPVKGRCELSKKSFKRYCGERFSLDEKTSLKDFIESKSKQLAFEYIAFLFEYKEEVWTDEILFFFEWLIETFRQNRTDKPTFLFFFVIKTDGVDEAGKMQQDIEELVNRHAEASLMMPNLQSVPNSDILTWFKNRIYAADLTKVEKVLTAYLSSNNLPQSTDPIEMRHLEDLQKSIYATSLTTHLKS